MTKLRHLALMAIFSMAPSISTGQPSQELLVLLSSIDRPLTRLDLQYCQAEVDVLLSIAGAPDHSLYRRGRAIAALGQLNDPSGLSGLIELWDSDLEPGLEVEIVYAINALDANVDIWHLTSLFESRLSNASPPVFLAITRILGLDAAP